jgi:acetolactate synthase I/II/III large subunit
MAVAERRCTASWAMLEAMREAGVRYLFANLGSDHTGIVEAYAQAQRDGSAAALPELVICPHEFVALSAAQGYAQVSGQAQAVLVHVDCGTQNLGGALHNVARARVPVLILAGLTPATADGELPGSRNEFIHWLQDTPDQAGIVRGYVKYAHEVRTGRNAKQLVHRALQIARSEPPGPVYLTAAREVMEETIPVQPDQRQWWSPVAPMALADEVAGEIAAALAGASAPLVVTSYLGRDASAVTALTELCELAAIGVIESVPMRMNFPADHPLHLGYQWTTAGQNPVLAEADVVLVAGSDVPWIPATNRPAPGARIYVIDIDPIKEQMPLWHVPAARYARADLATALRQVTARLRQRGGLATDEIAARAGRLAADHRAQRQTWAAAERPRADGTITPEYLVACVREAIGPHALVLTEAITNYQVVSEHLRLSRPGSLLGSGGSSLGWAGGAAVGAKLAAPAATVVSLVGDGSYLFSVPSSVQWLARRCGTPSLTVIFDNLGWAAPQMSALMVHPSGAAAEVGAITGFTPEADLPGVAAAAGGAYAATVTQAAKLPVALGLALSQLRRGRSAVISVHVPSAAPPPTGSHHPPPVDPGQKEESS